MPSPFPGMDPYLESPALWRGVHHGLISFIWMQLNARLPARYVANIDERLVVVDDDRDIYPDSLVKEFAEEPRTKDHPPTGATATAGSDPAVHVPLAPAVLAEGFIEIRLAQGEGRVVTVIEVLSPTNKTTRSQGRDQYLDKQRDLLESAIHLLEIDLLRAGTYSVAAPRNRLPRRKPWAYVISLHRVGATDCEVWLADVPERLPRVAVPLADEDPDLVLDVQEMVTQCYEAGNFVRQIDYRREPVPPFGPTHGNWADTLLRERGLRP